MLTPSVSKYDVHKKEILASEIFPAPLTGSVFELNRQKGEDLRQPQARYRVRSSVTSAHNTKKSLNLVAMMLLAITYHKANAL